MRNCATVESLMLTGGGDSSQPRSGRCASRLSVMAKMVFIEVCELQVCRIMVLVMF